MKSIRIVLLVIALCFLSTLRVYAENDIIHDGEYLFLEAQYGEKWDAEDKDVDAKLAEIRKKNGGKRPNILYVLIDDVSFGQMGNRAMNYVTGLARHTYLIDRAGNLAAAEQRIGNYLLLGEIAKGKNNAAVAEALFISERAVEKHIGSIFTKLDLSHEEDTHHRVRAVLLYLTEGGS